MTVFNASGNTCMLTMACMRVTNAHSSYDSYQQLSAYSQCIVAAGILLMPYILTDQKSKG